ncbi:hypothetical protein L6V77_05635 [Myxococcota bacterium]|nr:hypothetical protein [Myxococcota bacterium]
MAVTLTDLRRMSNDERAAIVRTGSPLDLAALSSAAYRGVDLSLPPFMHRLLWQTFMKAFVADPARGEVRGWNIRLEQTGLDGPLRPLRTRNGRARTFGHYRVRPADGVRFPGGWSGGHFLDYRNAGNPPWDAARYTTSPLVAVNPGDMRLLLGWEIFRFGPLTVPLADYWALEYVGPVAEADIVPPPRPVSGRVEALAREP